MTFCRAVIPPIVLVALLSSALSGSSSELSITRHARGKTVRIPCPSGEAIVRNIFWYYNDGSTSHRILSLSTGNVTITAPYADRAGLEKDNSTLTLENVTVHDGGRYRCDVDRQGQTAILNITTTLIVYGLPPKTSPIIRQCLQSSPTCSGSVQGPINLTCEFKNVYPTTNTSLGWYHRGHGPLGSPVSISEAREDGTFDLDTILEAKESGEWMCKASYISVHGIEETTTSIMVTKEDGAGSPMNLVRIIVPIVVVAALVVGIVVLILVIRRRKKERAKGQYGHVGRAEKIELGNKVQDGIDDGILANIAEALEEESDLSRLGRNLGIRQFKLNQIIKENEKAKDTFPATSMLFTWKEKTPAAKQVSKMVKALDQSGMETLISEHFPNEAGVSDEKIAELADNLKDEQVIEQLGINFGFRQFKVNQYLNMNKDRGDHSGTMAMLREWRKKTPRTRQISDLVEALKNADLDGSFNNNQNN